MSEKRFVVKLSSGDDTETYYNAGNKEGVPNAFGSSQFIEEGDAKTISKAKKGSVVCELEPKAQIPKPKPPAISTVLGIVFLGFLVTRMAAEMGTFRRGSIAQPGDVIIEYEQDFPEGDICCVLGEDYELQNHIIRADPPLDPVTQEPWSKHHELCQGGTSKIPKCWTEPNGMQYHR